MDKEQLRKISRIKRKTAIKIIWNIVLIIFCLQVGSIFIDANHVKIIGYLIYIRFVFHAWRIERDINYIIKGARIEIDNIIKKQEEN